MLNIAQGIILVAALGSGVAAQSPLYGQCKMRALLSVQRLLITI